MSDVYHTETRKMLPGAKSAKVIEAGPLRAGLGFEVDFAPSILAYRAFLAADSKIVEFECEVEWAHKHKFLKGRVPRTRSGYRRHVRDSLRQSAETDPCQHTVRHGEV